MNPLIIATSLGISYVTFVLPVGSQQSSPATRAVFCAESCCLFGSSSAFLSSVSEIHSKKRPCWRCMELLLRECLCWYHSLSQTCADLRFWSQTPSQTIII